MASSRDTPKQLEMFEFTEYGEEQMKGARRTPWFFVTDAKSTCMIVGLECGKLDLVPYDTRFTVPWLTNNRKEAIRVSRAYSGLVVQRYPYNPSHFGRSNVGKGGWKPARK